jgi:hypothetical protein
MPFIDDSSSDSDSSVEARAPGKDHVDENTVPDLIEAQVTSKVVIRIDFFRASLVDPILRRVCAYCVEKARRAWPYYGAYIHALEAGALGYQKLWGACPMCTLGYARVITDYLAEIGCSARRDLSVGIMRDVETRIGFMVTLPDGKEVALELDSDETFEASGEPCASEAYRLSLAGEVLKMLFFRSQGVKFVRFHQENMREAGWRSRLHQVLFDSSEAFDYVGEMPGDRWRSLRLEVDSWKDFGVKDWVRANKYRFARMMAWDQRGGGSPSSPASAKSV